MKNLIRVLAWFVLNSLLYPVAAQEANPAPEEAVSPIKVNVQGASEALADNLKAHLPSLRNLKCDTGRDRIERFIDASREKLREGAEAMGYFSARFQIIPLRVDNCWQLNIAVVPGQAVKVSRINVRVTGEGESLPAFQKITSELPYKPGDVLVSQKYEDFKTNLSRTAGRLGFFDAKFEKRTIAVNPQTKQADIDLHFVTGKRYQFGEVDVDQEILGDKYIKRYVNIQPGQAYDADELLKQRRLLENSGYYLEVDIDSQFQKAEQQKVPVKINAKRRKRYTYKGTLGFESDSGLYLKIENQTHWVNDKGHQLNGALELAQDDSDRGFALGLKLGYRVPLWNPEHEFFEATAEWTDEDRAGLQTQGLELNFGYNRRTDNDWQQGLSISVLDEKVSSADSSDRSQLTLFGARLSKTQRDATLFPKNGWRVLAEAKGGAEGFLSDQTVLYFNVEGKYLYTFDHEGKFITRGRLGAVFADNFEALPRSLRFFAGGQSSVRGYALDSIGEKNSSGDVIGGARTLVGSFEYEYPVTENIGLAAFVDAGNAFDSFETSSFEVGAGVGVRYKSPLGPVRVDFASPTDDPGDVHFYFSLGPDL